MVIPSCPASRRRGKIASHYVGVHRPVARQTRVDTVTAPRLAPLRPGRVALLAALIAAIGAFFALGLHHQLTFEALRAHARDLAARRDHDPVRFAGLYLLAYILMAAMAIPGAAIMTLAGGALFGLAEGVLLASFGSSIGATLAMLASRYLFRDLVRRHFRGRLDQVDRGLAREGWLYLASLRLVPAIPFFVVDLLFGVTAFPALRFYAVSQAAMLPATLVYVNAGTQLERLHGVSGILSPHIAFSLLLLACLPLLARLLIKRLTRTR